MDGVFVSAVVVAQFTFAGAGPGPSLPARMSLHGGAQAVSNMTEIRPVTTWPAWAFQHQQPRFGVEIAPMPTPQRTATPARPATAGTR